MSGAVRETFLAFHISQSMPQSILKTPFSSITAPSPPAARLREDRNKETALYHAHLLQQRKDAEALILASTESLLDLPSSLNADPARPASPDANLVRNSLKLFQPSDYNSLIEERNINKQCGYVLCPQPNRLEDTKAKYRIIPGEGKGNDAVRFVERQALERWCSDDCGKRALYIKVQLNEEPAWTRTPTTGGNIVILEDKTQTKQGTNGEDSLTQRLRNFDISQEGETLTSLMKVLAIERGDGDAPSRSFGLAEVDVQEKANTNSRSLSPMTSTEDQSSNGPGDTIEGYRPKFSDSKLRGGKFGQEEHMVETI